MIAGNIKAILNVGEDIAHIHPNQNKIQKALDNLDFIMVQELFMTEIAKAADIVIGVKSAYEKTGVYVNAMRRLHLSQPLVESPLPDDWEVLAMIDQKMGGDFKYHTSEDVWNEVTEVAHRRFSGAKYYRLERHRKRGMQWPIHHEDTPVLHLLDFRTSDGLGEFHYYQYKIRGMVQEILEKKFYDDSLDGYYLTTGRTLVHYNNAAQTKESTRLNDQYNEDILLAPLEAEEIFGSDMVILKTKHGVSKPLPVKYTDKVRAKTLFCTFHHAKSNINMLFGDECDELVMTARFKSLKVEVVPQYDTK
jgi:formate dehydrogenase major subunit